MSEPIDLTGCENEPINIPGAIRTHGVLLILEPVTFTVLQTSANSLSFLDVAPNEILGRSIADWIDADSFRALSEAPRIGA